METITENKVYRIIKISSCYECPFFGKYILVCSHPNGPQTTLIKDFIKTGKMIHEDCPLPKMQEEVKC